MLRDSDVYIMPSVSEPFGISPLEAMEMGVPSIISKQSGCAEILTNVIKTDYWDIDAMADAIHSILHYPAMYHTLRDKGIEEIHGITWEKVGKRVIERRVRCRHAGVTGQRRPRHHHHRLTPQGISPTLW